MKSILEEIGEKTKSDLKRRRRDVTIRDLESINLYEQPVRDFKHALLKDDFTIIAELKKASPSKGVIREDFNPLKIAEEYIEGGAATLSVLTDKPFFQGDIRYLNEISSHFNIPLLRKDFIVDPYQIKEAKAHGADAILLIVTMLSDSQLDELLSATSEFGLSALVECYSREDVDRINWEKISLFGVNNRDLNTFQVDIHRGVDLLTSSPEHIVRISESGLYSAEDLLFLKRLGIGSALIGEYFMRQPSPGKALSELLSMMAEQPVSKKDTHD